MMQTMDFFVRFQLFPAGAAGGVDTVRTMQRVAPDLSLIPAGGIPLGTNQKPNGSLLAEKRRPLLKQES